MPARQFFIFLRIFGHLEPLATKSHEIPGLAFIRLYRLASTANAIDMSGDHL